MVLTFSVLPCDSNSTLRLISLAHLLYSITTRLQTTIWQGSIASNGWFQVRKWVLPHMTLAKVFLLSVCPFLIAYHDLCFQRAYCYSPSMCPQCIYVLSRQHFIPVWFNLCNIIWFQWAPLSIPVSLSPGRLLPMCLSLSQWVPVVVVIISVCTNGITVHVCDSVSVSVCTLREHSPLFLLLFCKVWSCGMLWS